MKWKLKKKIKNILSVFLTLILLVSLGTSSFVVMAETTIGEGIDANSQITQSANQLAPSQVEEAQAEAPQVLEPLPESPKEELPVEEPKLEKLAPVPTAMLAPAPMAVITPLAVGDIPIQNFLQASGQSTNNRYMAEGVYIDTNGDAHILLFLTNNPNYQERFYDPMLNGTTVTDFSWQALGPNATFVFPDNTRMTIGNGYETYQVWDILDLNVGPISNLQAVNSLSVLNSAHGWDIIMTVTINIEYNITKDVDKTDATIGDELIYTIGVTNTGDFSLSGIEVTDTIPSGITIIEISKDNGVTWVAPTIAGGIITLDTDLTLASMASKTYKVKAYINDSATDGVIVNTATIGGDVIPKIDTAQVTIHTADITVNKLISGNFGEVSREFPFTVKVNKVGHYTEKTFNFELTHNETYNLSNLPTDAVLTLTEGNNSGYEVIVTVDGNPIIPSEGGVYTINVGSMSNKTITVTNENNVVIDTGISLDSLPYVLILVFAVVGLVAMFVRKRNIHN